MRLTASIFTAIWATLTLGGCYGAKMVKTPINAEQARVRADSLAARQARILDVLARLERRAQAETEARQRQGAETTVTLNEIADMVSVLSSRIDENTRFLQGGSGAVRPRSTPPPRAVVQRDTAALDSVPALAGSDPAAANRLFRESYMDLTQGNYDLAIQGFTTYLVRYPEGAQLPEVHYYLGECYYADNRFLESVGEFQYVVREFPDSRLVPAAYLKSGLCYRGLGEINLAERAFTAVIEQFSHTEEAERARSELEALER